MRDSRRDVPPQIATDGIDLQRTGSTLAVHLVVVSRAPVEEHDRLYSRHFAGVLLAA